MHQTSFSQHRNVVGSKDYYSSWRESAIYQPSRALCSIMRHQTQAFHLTTALVLTWPLLGKHPLCKRTNTEMLILYSIDISLLQNQLLLLKISWGQTLAFHSAMIINVQAARCLQFYNRNVSANCCCASYPILRRPVNGEWEMWPGQCYKLLAYGFMRRKGKLIRINIIVILLAQT